MAHGTLIERIIDMAKLVSPKRPLNVYRIKIGLRTYLTAAECLDDALEFVKNRIDPMNYSAENRETAFLCAFVSAENLGAIDGVPESKESSNTI